MKLLSSPIPAAVGSLLLCVRASAWAPPPARTAGPLGGPTRRSDLAAASDLRELEISPAEVGGDGPFPPSSSLSSSFSSLPWDPATGRAAWIAAAVPLALALHPDQAQAATGGGGGQVASAFFAYGHYLSLFAIVGCLVTERLTVRAGMTDAEEDRLAVADASYGLSGLVLAYTGYVRTTAEWGKGFDYYAHEPVFWLKVVLVAVFGAVSLFPTTKIIQRSVAKRTGPLEPMSEALAARMTSLINAELLMVGSIPLTATLMARGVGYWDAFPWQAGAGAAVAVLGGLGFKYVNEALRWEEPAAAAAADVPKVE